MGIFFNGSSIIEKGTLYHFRNVFRHRSVKRCRRLLQPYIGVFEICDHNCEICDKNKMALVEYLGNSNRKPCAMATANHILVVRRMNERSQFTRC